MLTTRVLPFDEWFRIAAIEPFASGGLPNPELWRIVVVEREGKIVACCSVFQTAHWDGFFVDPAERGNPVVFRQLLEGGLEVMRENGIDFVHTTVPDPDGPGAAMLEKFGFVRTPGALYYYVRKD